MKKEILKTKNGLELPCVILTIKSFTNEVLAYCQNRIIKGKKVGKFVEEMEILADFAIIPEFEEFLLEQEVKEEKVYSFRVLFNFKEYKFNSYSEALQFKLENGGKIFQKLNI